MVGKDEKDGMERQQVKGENKKRMGVETEGRKKEKRGNRWTGGNKISDGQE